MGLVDSQSIFIFRYFHHFYNVLVSSIAVLYSDVIYLKKISGRESVTADHHSKE
jgi:hypothetical protein